MRAVASIAVLSVCLCGTAALADIAAPPPVLTPPVKIVPVTISSPLRTAMTREQLRLDPKLTADQRTKLTAAKQSTRSALLTQLRSQSTVTTKSVLTTSRKAVTDASMDFSNMPIEDAMLLLMMMVSRDAEQDMRDQLAAMNETRKQREALREQMAAMKDASAQMQSDLRAQYDRATAAEAQAAERASVAKELHAKLTAALATLPQLALPDGGPPQ